MHIFREELKTTKASRKKLTVRLRAMRKFILWHYVLLALSIVNSFLTLFVAVNTNVSYQGTIFIFSCVSLALSCYLLLAGIAK